MSSVEKHFYPWLIDYGDKLSRYLQQDRLPSAIMLVGSEGLGLSAFAQTFANRVFCLATEPDGAACGSCASCLLFKAGNYPDYFHVVAEEGKTSIGIDAIRQLSETLSLNSQYLKPRMVVIDPVDALLHQASNSLLKTLEEPSDNTCLVLIAHQPSRIPATIRSRCQLIVMKDIDFSQAKQWLEALGCDNADEYLSLANYSPILAYELWQKNALAIRDALLEDFLNLMKGRLDPLLFAEKCFAIKDFPVLKWLVSWLTDAVKYEHCHESAYLMNADLIAHLKVLVEKLHLEGIHSLLALLAKLIKLESSQVNQQLMLEEFAIHCYSLTNKEGI
ncbi:MAG: DNA polymerase III subunit delta' C-terminal domain-containing protein [Cycloclasticus sp.]|nr:DNA polymerase III subunit delta' C-terminal domain-containing protein [Cycloclasticus sp.]